MHTPAPGTAQAAEVVVTLELDRNHPQEVLVLPQDQAHAAHQGVDPLEESLPMGIGEAIIVHLNLVHLPEVCPLYVIRSLMHQALKTLHSIPFQRPKKLLQKCPPTYTVR